MRFTLAVTAVLSQALPAWTAEEHAQTWLQKRNLFALNEAKFQTMPGKDFPRLRRAPIFGQYDNAVIRNRHSTIKNEEKPCDPTSRDPDIGILSCGSSWYCKQSTNSTLGGVCAEIGHDRALVSPGYLMCIDDSYPYECDCSHFDPTMPFGSVTCTLYPYQCIGCSNYCVEMNVHFAFDAHSVIKVKYCEYFKKPYEVELCYAFDHNAATCEYTINGEACKMCSSGKSIAFDCTNIPNGRAGSSQDFINPIVSKADALDPYVTCPAKYSNTSVSKSGSRRFSPKECVPMTALGIFSVIHFLAT